MSDDAEIPLWQGFLAVFDGHIIIFDPRDGTEIQIILEPEMIAAVDEVFGRIYPATKKADKNSVKIDRNRPPRLDS